MSRTLFIGFCLEIVLLIWLWIRTRRRMRKHALDLTIVRMEARKEGFEEGLTKGLATGREAGRLEGAWDLDYEDEIKMMNDMQEGPQDSQG
jgi:type VI protein secretion system component VasK